MPNSSTDALLVSCDNGKEYVLKHSGNLESGSDILIAEYLSYLLAHRFNLPIPEYCFVRLTRQFIRTIEDEDIRQMMLKVRPLCIGSYYIYGALPYNNAISRIIHAHKLLFRTILGLDQYLYNGDRFAINPNILFIPQTNTINVIDYSHAIWSWFDLETKILAPLQTLNEHVLASFAKKDTPYIAALIGNIYNTTINDYIDTIPAAWFTEDLTKEFLQQFLTMRRDSINDILKGKKCKDNTATNLSLL